MKKLTRAVESLFIIILLSVCVIGILINCNIVNVSETFILVLICLCAISAAGLALLSSVKKRVYGYYVAGNKAYHFEGDI